MQYILRDKPNPKANVAILLPPHFFFINAFKTVLENLSNAEFVIDFTLGGTQGVFSEGFKAALKHHLIRANIHWRDIESSGLLPAEFFDKYAVLAAPFHGGYIAAPYNKNKRKVRLCYGTAKDSWSFGLQNVYFDLILCPGKYAERKLAIYSAEVVAIGEPKLDELFRKVNSSGVITDASALQLNPNKQTLLYMPTYGSLSSLQLAIPALFALSVDYNVVVKLHHMTLLHDGHEAEKLRGASLVVLDQEVSVVDALRTADIVISDNSSSIFDALAAGKSLVLLDPIFEKERFFVEKPFFGFLNGKPRGASTYEGSIEQVIKDPGAEIAPVVRLLFQQEFFDEHSVRDALSKANDQKYLQRQKKIVEELFSFRDGMSGQRAAEAITKLLYSDSLVRDRTLERYVDEYDQRLRAEVASVTNSADESKSGQLERFERIKKLPYFERVKAVFAEYF